MFGSAFICYPPTPSRRPSSLDMPSTEREDYSLASPTSAPTSPWPYPLPVEGNAAASLAMAGGQRPWHRTCHGLTLFLNVGEAANP